MRRGWFIVLALSLGLNAGLLYTVLATRAGGPGLPFGASAPDDALFEEQPADESPRDQAPSDERPPANVPPGEGPFADIVLGDRPPGGPRPTPGPVLEGRPSGMPGRTAEGRPAILPASGPFSEPMMRRRVQGLSQRLGLDDAQREQFRAILQETMPRIFVLREQVEGARRALHIAYGRPQLDPAAIQWLTRDLTRSQAILDSLVAETMLREAKALSPEQRELYFRAMPWNRRPGPARGAGSERR